MFSLKLNRLLFLLCASLLLACTCAHGAEAVGPPFCVSVVPNLTLRKTLAEIGLSFKEQPESDFIQLGTVSAKGRCIQLYLHTLDSLSGSAARSTNRLFLFNKESEFLGLYELPFPPMRRKGNVLYFYDLDSGSVGVKVDFSEGVPDSIYIEETIHKFVERQEILKNDGSAR